MRDAFFGLSKNQLLNFFFHYERQFGSGARSYAEKAVMKWRTGSTRMSAQTTERLLQTLPPFLGTSVKYDLLRKLRERYRQPENWTLDVTTANIRETVKPLVQRLISKAYCLNLPAELEARLGWLSHADSQAATSLMAGAEASAMVLAVSRLDEEFAQIERLVATTPRGTVSHRIELPYGLITLNVKRGNRMDDRKSEILAGRTIDSAELTTSEQLLKHAIKHLTPEQLSEVSKKATEEALNLQVEAARADQKHVNSERDMERFIDHARRMDQTQSDYSVSGQFNTASGSTSVSANRNSSKTWIIVVIALAVLVVLLIMKG